MAGQWTVAKAQDLAQEFTNLEKLIDDEISYVMCMKDRRTQG